MTQQNEAEIEARKMWFKVLDDKEYKIARSAWGTFLSFHPECDKDGAIDTIAQGVLEFAGRLGYRLIPELKPLTDEEIWRIPVNEDGEPLGLTQEITDTLRAISQTTIDKVKRSLK